MLKYIDKSGLFFLILLIFAPFLVALYIGVDWQFRLSYIISDLKKVFESNYGVSFIFLVLMVLGYIMLGTLKIVSLKNDEFLFIKLFAFLFIEAVRIFFISLGSFVMIVSVTFENNDEFTTNTFYQITFLTFIITGTFYLVLRSISNFFLKKFAIYDNSKETEMKLFKLFEVNGIMYFAVTTVTVLILADTIGNTAFESVLSQIKDLPSESLKKKKPSLDNFIDSRLFSLIIPSLTVYILSIRTTLPQGIKKR